MKLAQVNTMLHSINGTTFAGIDTIVEVKLKGGRKNPHQGRITKRTIGSQVILFSDIAAYMKRVNRRLAAEGKDTDFEPAQRKWGVRVGTTPIIEHNGGHYLQVDFQRAGKSTYFLDDKEIAKSDIIGLDEKPVTSGRQGLEDENAVVIRTYALDSISELRMMGEVVQS